MAIVREREAARRQDSHPGRLGAEVEFYRAPERVAQRIGRYAALVGRENVIAGTDCGYGMWVGQAGVAIPMWCGSN